MILAGIVTYNPDIDRLQECLDAAIKQVDKIYIFDNASGNCGFIEQLIKGYVEKVVLYKNHINEGIAAALSNIMEYASDNGYDWVLTLDQDSVLQPGIIDVYRKAIYRFEHAGMFSCLIKDRNFTDNNNAVQEKNISLVPYCITSGALTSVAAYEQTPGYDKSFFIDGVDFDLCYSLREQGYKIYRVNRLGLLHEVGHGENRRFLWKSIVVYNESPERVYYIARNRIKLYRKHKEYSLYTLITKEIGLLFRICFYEKEKWKKVKMFWKGIGDGVRN